jgi:UBX domain-containing protein 7
MDDQIAQFSGITAATTSQAEQYLSLTEGNLEQAIQLYFEDPSLATGTPSAPAAAATASPLQPVAAPSRPKRKTYTEDDDGVVHVDSDESEDFDMGEASEPPIADTDADAEMARRLQEEMYSGGGNVDADVVRAPMARTTETLIGPGFDDDDISHMVQQQLLERRRRTNPREFWPCCWMSSSD